MERSMQMKRKGKQRIALWLVGALVIGLLQIQDSTVGEAAVTSQTKTAQAEDVITYDAAEFEPLKGRTEEEAGKKYAAARYFSPRYEDSDMSGLYTEWPEQQPSEKVLSEDAEQTITAMFNYYRWLAGSADAEWGGSSLYQQEAYRIRDLKQQEPIQYMFMYSQGATPLTALKNAMNEACVSWSSMTYFRHDAYRRRENIIRPYTAELSMGFYGEWLVMNRPGEDKSREAMPFYSFPSQGYMPNDLLTADESAWSVWIDQSKLKIPTEYDKKESCYISRDVSVTVLHRESGEKFERSMDKENAYADENYIVFEGPIENGLSAYIGTYDVEVTGLQDVATGKPAKLCYTITFFEPSQYLLSKVKEVSLNGVVKYVMPQQMATLQNCEKLAAILPEEVTVTGENGRNIILPVKGKWRYDEAGACWKNSVDVSKLPSDLTDPDGVLSDFPIHCEVGDNQGLTFEMNCAYALNYTHPTVGKGGKIIIKRNPQSAIDSAVVYQITKPGEEYTAAIQYSTKSSWGVTEDKENNAFVIPCDYYLEDTGDYVVVGYAEGGREAWLPDAIIPILVTEWEPWEPDKVSPGNNDTGGGTAGGGTAGGGTGGGGAAGGNSGGNDVSYSDNEETGTAGSEKTNIGEKTNTEKKKKQGSSKKTRIPNVAKVKKYKVRAKKKGFVLTWKKNTKVSGYQVQVSTKRNFKGAKKFSIKKSKNRYTISKLKPGKKYYIRIRAYQTYQTQTGSKKKSNGKWVVKSCRTKR